MRLALFAVLTLAATAGADGPVLSANPYAPNSTSNPHGIYGSATSPLSANNPYGQGLQFSAPAPTPAAMPVIHIYTAPEPTRTYDFSGLSRLEYHEGHPVIGEEVPALTPDLKAAMPEPERNIIDALYEIRKAGRAQ